MTAGNPRNVGRALPARLQLLLPFGAGTLCRASPSTPSRCPGRILSHQGRAESNSAQSWPRPEQCGVPPTQERERLHSLAAPASSPGSHQWRRRPPEVLTVSSQDLSFPQDKACPVPQHHHAPGRPPLQPPGPYGPGQKTTARAPGTGRSQNKGFKLQPRIPPVPVLKQNLARHQ